MSSFRAGSVLARQVVARAENSKSEIAFKVTQWRNFASQSNGNGSSTVKLALIGASLGAASGTAYSLYQNWKDQNSHKELERIEPKMLDLLPNIKITKRFVNQKDKSGLDLVLFQYQTCPFCCKVRAFLDYMGISYSVVEVNAVLKQDLKWSEYKKVPMVLVRKRDGQYVQLTDSSTIISVLASYLNDKKQDIIELSRFYPHVTYFDDFGRKKQDVMNKYFLMYQEKIPKGITTEMQESDRKWRNWTDNHLVHLISPNCYQTPSEALETFEWFSEAGEWNIHFPNWERNMMVYVGATVMWVISKILKRRYDLSDDVRSHMYDALDLWTKELEKKNIKFMGGNQPNLADLSVFGVLSSMEGCQTFKDCLQNTNIGEWFYSVKELISKNRGSRERLEGSLTNESRRNVA